MFIHFSLVAFATSVKVGQLSHVETIKNIFESQLSQIPFREVYTKSQHPSFHEMEATIVDAFRVSSVSSHSELREQIAAAMEEVLTQKVGSMSENYIHYEASVIRGDMARQKQRVNPNSPWRIEHDHRGALEYLHKLLGGPNIWNKIVPGYGDSRVHSEIHLQLNCMEYSGPFGQLVYDDAVSPSLASSTPLSLLNIFSFLNLQYLYRKKAELKELMKIQLGEQFLKDSSAFAMNVERQLWLASGCAGGSAAVDGKKLATMNAVSSVLDIWSRSSVREEGISISAEREAELKLAASAKSQLSAFTGKFCLGLAERLSMRLEELAPEAALSLRNSAEFAQLHMRLLDLYATQHWLTVDEMEHGEYILRMSFERHISFSGSALKPILGNVERVLQEDGEVEGFKLLPYARVYLMRWVRAVTPMASLTCELRQTFLKK